MQPFTAACSVCGALQGAADAAVWQIGGGLCDTDADACLQCW